MSMRTNCDLSPVLHTAIELVTMKLFIRYFAIAALFFLPAAACANPQNGYWYNPTEGGRGYFIEIQDSAMFFAAFMYDANGHATWFASEGSMTSTTQYNGSLITYANGQTLTGIYKSPVVSNPQAGNIAISFSNDTTATLTLPNGTQVPIQRFAFGPGGVAAQTVNTNLQTGFYWNPSAGGSGYTIEMQGYEIYMAAFMYDADGSPVWYLATNRIKGPNLDLGVWTQYANGQTLTGTYMVPIVSNTDVGSMTLQFPTSITATLTLPNFTQIPLNRFNFASIGNPSAPNTQYFSCENTAYSYVIPVGDYAFNLNPWGAGWHPPQNISDITDFFQCMYVTPTATGINVYWDWSWPLNVGGSVKSAPNIEWRPDGQPMIPTMLENLNNLTVNHEYVVNANGPYNVNYELWINSTPPPVGTEPDYWTSVSTEVEVLLDDASWYVNPDVVETITIGGYQFGVEHGINNGGNQFIIFQNLGPIPKASFKVKDFADYMVSKGWQKPTDYLFVISFGTEIGGGSGSLTLNNFSVTQ